MYIIYYLVDNIGNGRFLCLNIYSSNKISIHEKIFYLLLAIAKFPTTSKKRQFYED